MVWQALRFVLAFGAVLAAAAGASRWLARQTRGAQAAGLRVVGGVHLGGGRSLCAVHVGRRVLVLALADKQVRLVQTITDPEEVASLAGPGPDRPSVRAGAPGAPGFATAWLAEWQRLVHARDAGAADPEREGEHVD